MRWFLVAALGSTLVLIAAASAQPVAPLKSGESMRLPFEYTSHRNALLVYVSVNGKKALLILDTGSAHTVLRPEVVGLKRKELSAAHLSPGGGLIGDAVGKEVMLQVGEHVLPKYRIVVMDLSQVLQAYQENLDGVLGMDFLRNYSQITIDLREHKIVLSR
jgi:Aspartyl protease